jgi:hypothetical protein
MATESDRVAVQTYVPAEQREEWKREAERLDMSQAEYVRTMIQAGRRGFDLQSDQESVDSTSDLKEDISNETPGGKRLKDRVLDVLRESEFADWEMILAGVTDDVEERLEAALDELQSEDRIRYSGRHGGYTVIDDER